MILQKLKEKPFIHFNLQTFGSNHIIPFEFTKSFKHLPPDNYIKNNDPVTRSRKYANLKVDVTIITTMVSITPIMMFLNNKWTIIGGSNVNLS